MVLLGHGRCPTGSTLSGVTPARYTGFFCVCPKKNKVVSGHGAPSLGYSIQKYPREASRRSSCQAHGPGLQDAHSTGTPPLPAGSVLLYKVGTAPREAGLIRVRQARRCPTAGGVGSRQQRATAIRTAPPPPQAPKYRDRATRSFSKCRQNPPLQRLLSAPFFVACPPNFVEKPDFVTTPLWLPAPLPGVNV
jgi:hypothetical protein